MHAVNGISFVPVLLAVIVGLFLVIRADYRQWLRERDNDD